jgi:hypothetical protein
MPSDFIMRLKIPILILLLVATAFLTSSAQKLGIYGPIVVLPENPTASSFIKLVIPVSASSQPLISTGIDFEVNSFTINAKACYFIGIFSSPITIRDTLVLGTVPAGYYTLNFTINPYQEADCKRTDSVVTVFDFGVKGASPLEALVYPNPARNVLFINHYGLTVQSIKLLDIQGRMIAQYPVLTKNLDISGLAKGVYLLRIFADEGVVLKKIIKQ